MSAVAENILTGLPAGRAAVFLGEAGCGKSELAVHLALSLAGKGREVHFFDLDQTKPLMRSRDAQELLEGAGVTVHFERQTADAPTQVGGLVPLLLAPDKNVILDVGGGDAGARLIGGYSHLLKNADVWFIVNPYRPWSGSTEHIDGTLSAILRAAEAAALPAQPEPRTGDDGGGISRGAGGWPCHALAVCPRGGGRRPGGAAGAGRGPGTAPAHPHHHPYIRSGNGA